MILKRKSNELVSENIVNALMDNNVNNIISMRILNDIVWKWFQNFVTTPRPNVQKIPELFQSIINH